MEAVIECRSTQQINDDYMLETLAELDRDLAKWTYYSWQPPKQYLSGKQREYAVALKCEIEDAILTGVTLDTCDIARRMIFLITMPHAY